MTIVAIVLQVLLAAIFLLAGGGKLAGAETHMENFARWGYPQWFRVVTGVCEVAGAAGLLVGIKFPQVAGLAGMWLALVMAGAVLTHLTRDPLGPATAAVPAVLLLLAATVAVLRLRVLAKP